MTDAAATIDTLTLAASERLARALREDHSLRCRRDGLEVWEAPRIQSLRQWLQDAWTSSWPAEQLLHAAQELALWRDAIESDEAGAALLAPLSAAREARRADQLALRYGIDPASAGAHREDTAAFVRWRRAVHQRLARRGWITAGDLPAQVVRGLREGRIAAPARVRLAGFIDELAPAECAVVDALRAAGSEVEAQPAPAQPGRVRRLRHADAADQFRAIAAAVRERLAPYADHAEPPPRLILALPDPQARRELIESVFRPALAPWLAAVEPGARPLPWRWDAGAPLAEQPAIAFALAVAELRETANAPPLIGRVLLSPALWSEDERLLGADAEARLREQGWPRISMARLIQAAAAPLQRRLQALAEVMASAPSRALPSAWGTHWRARLQALGWPGAAAGDSVGYQTLREFDRLLARLSSMDAQLAQVSAGEALIWLRELARAARFEPRVEYTQPLLILSIEDAAGMPCDTLYLADVTAERFPGAQTPSAYLPIELQRAAGVPGAAPALSLQRARRLAQHLRALAPEVHLAFAEFDETGAQRLPSPLFGAEAQWQAASAPPLLSGIERIAAQGPRCRLPEQDPVPPVGEVEKSALRTGAELFKAWFESPFFAFARFRLGITPLPPFPRGLDARRQGNVAHAVLQALWSELGDSTALAGLDDDALAVRIAAALEPALQQHMPAADYGSVPLALERARLADVIAQWLRHERRRLDAFSIAQLEAEADIVVGGLPMRLRIDRIDRVRVGDDERYLVIDYKTGRNADPKGWRVERLEEPQLPLYASHALTEALGVPRVDGICFAHLKDGHPALSAETSWRRKLIEGEVFDARAEWDAKLAAWRLHLAECAWDFLMGVAGVKPRVNARSPYASLLLLAGETASQAEET